MSTDYYSLREHPFPDAKVGKGKKIKDFRDFNNLVYELNACDSFNLNLIKRDCKGAF